nr:hypothetical protein CFP56_15051 [Quercus suber]
MLAGEGHCDEEKAFLSPSVASMEPCPLTALAITFAGVVVYGGKSLGAVARLVQVVDQFSASLFVQMEKMILPDLVESFFADFKRGSSIHLGNQSLGCPLPLSGSGAAIPHSHVHYGFVGN